MYFINFCLLNPVKLYKEAGTEPITDEGENPTTAGDDEG
jgi:hypothetical protein